MNWYAVVVRDGEIQEISYLHESPLARDVVYRRPEKNQYNVRATDELSAYKLVKEYIDGYGNK